ncbi:unnamed protein product, partial [Rotaria sp. Silwood1]
GGQSHHPPVLYGEACVTQGFHAGHLGVDIGSYGAKSVNLYAVWDGTVIGTCNGAKDYDRATCGDCGNYVQIRYNTVIVTYCHMKSGSLTVTNGQRVAKAQIVGLPTRFFNSFGLDLTARYDIPCKFYMITLLGSLSSSALFIALVSIERWLNSCIEANYRIISSMKNVNRAIITIVTILILCYGQMLYCHAANQKSSRGACAGINIVCLYLNDFIHLILFVIIPVSIMIIYGLLTLRNIKQTHHRIANINRNQINNNVRGGGGGGGGGPQRQQSTLTALMLIQVCLITICNLPVGIHKIYSTITENTYKSPKQRGIETIIFQLVYLLTFVGTYLC